MTTLAHARSRAPEHLPPPRRDLPVRDVVTPSGDRLSQLIAAWLGGYAHSPHTMKAYRRDLADYLTWCAKRQLDPIKITLSQAQMYSVELAASLSPHSARTYSATSAQRKLAAVSSFYLTAARLGALSANPFRDVKRPSVPPGETPTLHVSAAQLRAMHVHATDRRHRSFTPAGLRLSLGLLGGLGIRVAELCRANLGDLGEQDGYPVLHVHMKGAKQRLRPLPTHLKELLDVHLAERGHPIDAPLPLLARRDGVRVTEIQVYRLTQTLARQAGVAHWRKITPHSLRHTFNTLAREAGAELEDRQFALGHSNSSTTQRYDHTAVSIRRDPAHLVDRMLF